MYSNASISSRKSSNKSTGNSLPMYPMLTSSFYSNSECLTSFDASNFVFKDHYVNYKKKKQSLRRYNSHDSQINFDNIPSGYSNLEKVTSSVKSSENLSECNIGEYTPRDFVEKYSLPRVVKLKDEEEPLLLYKCFDSFTKVEAKGVSFKKGKEKMDERVLCFPEGYMGWFSLVNDKGEKSAVTYTTIMQLVREQVCSFISLQPFTAYTTESTALTDSTGKVQYLKTQVRAGQLFQLRAVFQDKMREDGSGKFSIKSYKLSNSARDRGGHNRYAQLISQNNQEYYVQLLTKGEFYEIHSSIKSRLCFPGMLDKTGPLALDKDCLYQINHLSRRMSHPLKVKLIAGTLPSNLPIDYTDYFVLERKIQDAIVVTCNLPLPNTDTPYQINFISFHSDLKMTKCSLGFESENKLFKSQRLQMALAFCHKNVEHWYREIKLTPNMRQVQSRKVINHCMNCKRNKCICEKPQSIKPVPVCLPEEQKQLISVEVCDKFAKPKKWYKNFKLFNHHHVNDHSKTNEGRKIDTNKYTDRYKDMSKLIEEKCGLKNTNPVKKSASFMFTTSYKEIVEVPIKNKITFQKCQSLDNQLFSVNDVKRQNSARSSLINFSDSLSNDFQMCILDNENSPFEEKAKPTINPDCDNLQNSQIVFKNKPDVIPTLSRYKNSYITDRLCSEFHVKTKKHKKLSSVKNDICKRSSSVEFFTGLRNEITTIQVHEVPRNENRSLGTSEVPYCSVADHINAKSGDGGSSEENDYAEICGSSSRTSDSKSCNCARTEENSDYCYVKLAFNDTSNTNIVDEAIYSTLK